MIAIYLVKLIILFTGINFFVFIVYSSALQRNPVLIVQQGSLLNSVRREYSTFFTQGMFISCP